MNDLGNHLSEQHQFYIALIAQVSSIVSMIFLYRSNPSGKKPDDASK